MQAILDTASKYINPENVEIFSESWNEDSVDFEMNHLKSIKSRQVAGYSVRIIKDGRIGFTGGTSYDPEDMVKRALNSAKFGPKALFEFAGKTPMSSPKTYDPNIEKLKVNDMTQRGTKLLEYLQSKRSDIQWDIFIKRHVSSKRVLSGKLDRMCRSTHYDFTLVAHSIKEGDFLHIYDAFSTSSMCNDEMKLAEKILEQLELAGKEVEIKTAVMPVIFSPSGIKDIMRNLMVNVNGKMVEKGASPLAEKLGKKILSESVSIYDDGTIDGTAVAEPFDDEGIAVKRYPIVEKGVLKNFVLDLHTASVLKMKPTGSGARSYSSQPRPSVHGIIIQPGDVSTVELMSDIKEGIYIDQLMGAHTGNPFTGDFQQNVDLGFKIENGKKTGRVKNVMIAGNFYQLFDSLAAFSKETKWEGSYRLPWSRFEKLSVASK